MGALRPLLGFAAITCLQFTDYIPQRMRGMATRAEVSPPFNAKLCKISDECGQFCKIGGECGETT